MEAEKFKKEKGGTTLTKKNKKEILLILLSCDKNEPKRKLVMFDK